MCLLTAIAGCAGIPPEPQALPDIAEPEPEPTPAPQVGHEPSPSPSPQPPVIAPPEQVPETFTGRAAIVLSNLSPAYANVARELSYVLDEPLLYNLADKSLPSQAAFAGIARSDAAIVIAIGLVAAEAAVSYSTVPVVYCQVFNFTGPDEASVPFRGVAAIPPLAKQVRAWKNLDPELEKIGTILGDGHEDLLAEAQRATDAIGVDLHYRIARSDRETLYLFNRMAPGIDGFWLFPDNRVLSVSVLQELMSIAARHRVRVAVFNDGLLQMGASLSSASVDADIAATVLSVAARITAGDADSSPQLTPLSDMRLEIASPVSGAADVVAVGAEDAGGAPKGRL